MALLYTHSAPEARTCSAAGDFQVYPGRGSHKVYHHDREVDNMTTQTRNEVLLGAACGAMIVAVAARRVAYSAASGSSRCMAETS